MIEILDKNWVIGGVITIIIGIILLLYEREGKNGIVNIFGWCISIFGVLVTIGAIKINLAHHKNSDIVPPIHNVAEEKPLTEAEIKRIREEERRKIAEEEATRKRIVEEEIERIRKEERKRIAAEEERRRIDNAAAERRRAAEEAERNKVQPTRTTIRYNGPYGCVLQISITIAGKTVVPQGNSIVIPDLPRGQQKYEIRGTITCYPGVSCMAYGTGNINIQQNSTFNVKWWNNAIGACTIWLE